MKVAGADVAGGRWIVVVVEDGRFDAALRVDRLLEIDELARAVAILAIDIPIGLPADGEGWPRQADIEARALLGAKWPSVFLAPPAPILACSSYDAANRAHREITGKGLSRQAWGLCDRILEAAGFTSEHPNVVEVHPELSFQAMKGGALRASKKTWNGQMERRALLRRQGITIPDQLEAAGGSPPDDVLDAAAAAWSARRIAKGGGGVVPASVPQADLELRGLIRF